MKSETLLLFVSEQVGRLQCPLLLVVGEDDQNWCAYESAMDVSLLTRDLPVFNSKMFIIIMKRNQKNC